MVDANAQDESESDRTVRVPSGTGELEGSLRIPTGAAGVVVFIHGSGSNRHSARNRLVARALGERGLGTLLFRLLTPEEEAIDLRTQVFRFDIRLLAERTVESLDWFAALSELRGLRIGLFGASTGAAAALSAAAHRPSAVAGVVCRGGRVDLAQPFLEKVLAPTLLIVGGADEEVLELNRRAYPIIGATERSLEVIDGATQLFEEPGSLERVSSLTGDWFKRCFATSNLPIQTQST